MTNPSEREALAEVINTLRETLDLSVQLSADAETLVALKTQIQSLNTAMKPYSGQKALPHFEANYGDNFNAILPYSPITGDYNPIAPPLKVRHRDEQLVAEIRLGRIYEGPPDLVHGSVVAALYDQIMAFAAIDRQVPGYTANLSVDYLAGTPLFEQLTFTSWVERIEGKKVTVKAECHSNGTLLTRCEGLFIAFQART